MKSKKSKSKRKFVVWLENHVDRDDDYWVVVYAKSEKEAYNEASFDSCRFSKGRVYTANEFRKLVGFPA